MKHLLASAAVAGLMSLAPAAVHAAPGVTAAPSVPSAPIVLAEGGCGPGGFRDRFGQCVFRRPPPRPIYRGCPRFAHPTPYGCRPNY